MFVFHAARRGLGTHAVQGLKLLPFSCWCSQDMVSVLESKVAAPAPAVTSTLQQEEAQAFPFKDLDLCSHFGLRPCKLRHMTSLAAEKCGNVVLLWRDMCPTELGPRSLGHKSQEKRRNGDLGPWTHHPSSSPSPCPRPQVALD